MTRPAGRVQGVSKSRGSGRVGSGYNTSTSRGSGRVGSGRVGSGRVGSSQEVSNLAGRVGSARVKGFSKSRGSGRVMTREIRITRGSSHYDPQVVFG